MSFNTSNSAGAGREGARTGSSLLAPSKFSSNFLSGGSSVAGSNTSTSTETPTSKQSSESGGKTMFAGFKASKLSGVTQSLFGIEAKKDGEASPAAAPITWAAPVTATTTTPAAVVVAKEDSPAEKVKPDVSFLPLEPKSPRKESAEENGEKISEAKTSPVKRTPEKEGGAAENDVSSPKRVRLEVAPVVSPVPVKTDPKPNLDDEGDSVAAKAPTGESEVKRRKSETPVPVAPVTTAGALSPRSSAESSNFVFGENLTDRADNFRSVKAANFVFGQNLTERAVNFSPEPREEETAGTSSDLKTAAVTPAAPVIASSDPKSPPKSLSESAAAYYESHAPPKRKYDEVVVVTGEEGEVNVVQMSAKLHWFDKATGNWTERGRGLLRLNDIAELNAKTSAPPSSSRLVMRTSGSLRVILNTKLYRGMPVECPSEKTLRLTGMDDSGVLRVFLVTGAAKDISNMTAALQFRLAAIEKACLKEGRAPLTDEEDSDEYDDCSGSKIKAPRLV